MADESDCPVCEGERPVTWLITHLNPAATIRSCEQDFEAALIALLAARLDVESGWLSATIDTALEEIGQRADGAADDDQDEGERGTFGPEEMDADDDRELRDLTPEKFARKYGTDDDDTADTDE